MRCNQIVLLLSEHIQGELDPTREKEVEAHLLACASCRSERQAVLSISSALLQHPPPLPQSMQFQMMPDRLWAELEAQKKLPSRKGLWLRIFGFLITAQLLLFLLWPDPPSPRETPSPAPVANTLPSPEEQEEPFLFSLGDSEGFLDDLDEEEAGQIDARLFATGPEPEESFFIGGGQGDYLEELEELTPAELERLDTLLLAAREKG